MTEEERDDRVDTETPNEILPVVKLKGLRDNLEACIERPQDMTPEAYAQLEEYYAQAINASPCPCGKEEGGKPVTFGECMCKKLWWRAKKAWKNRETPEDKAAKQEFRDRIREDQRFAKEEAKVQVIARLGISADGDAVVLPVEGQQSYNIAMVQAVCEEAAKTLFVMMVNDQIHGSISKLAEHMNHRLDELGKMFEAGRGFSGL